MSRAQDFLEDVQDGVVDPAAPAAVMDPPDDVQQPVDDLSPQPLSRDADFDTALAQAQQPVDAPQSLEPAPTPASIRDRLVNELGFGALSDSADDWDAVQQVVNYAQQIDHQRQQLGAQMQQMQAQMQYLAQMQQHAQHRQVQPEPSQPAPQPAPQSTWPKAPEWDPAWMAGLTRNENGELVAKPSFDQTLPQKYHAYETWKENTMREMLADPVGFAQKAGILSAAEKTQQELVSKVRDEIKQEVTRELSQAEDYRYGQEFSRQHGHWMYQHDLAGNPLRDGAGNLVPTDDGQRLLTTLSGLTQRYQMPPRDALSLAFQMVSGQGSVAEAAAREMSTRANTVPATSPAQAQQQSNDRFLQRANSAAQMTRQAPRAAAAPAGTRASLSKYKGLRGERLVEALLNDVAANPDQFEGN